MIKQTARLAERRAEANSKRGPLLCSNCGGKINTTVPLDQQCKCSIFDRGRRPGVAK